MSLNSVSKTTGYELDGQDSIPGRSRISFSATETRLARRPTQPPVRSMGLKRSEPEADHSLQSRTKM
jgi:hypothetical protein